MSHYEDCLWGIIHANFGTTYICLVGSECKIHQILMVRNETLFSSFPWVLTNGFIVADFIHKITVQASPGLEKRRNSPDLGSGSSPSFGPRLRAIQREYSLFPSSRTQVNVRLVYFSCISTPISLPSLSAVCWCGSRESSLSENGILHPGLLWKSQPSSSVVY